MNQISPEILIKLAIGFLAPVFGFLGFIGLKIFGKFMLKLFIDKTQDRAKLKHKLIEIDRRGLSNEIYVLVATIVIYIIFVLVNMFI